MDPQTVLFYLFAMVSTVYVTHIGLYLIGANFYDIWQYRRQFRLLVHTASTIEPGASEQGDGVPEPAVSRRDSVLLVTVAIPAHNEEKVIVRCLESVRKSTYPNIEILVADDASHDYTMRIVRDYILRHPEMNIRIFRMRKNVGKGAALSTVLRRYAHGTFAMMIDADSIMGSDAISNAISYFDDPSVAGVAANVQIIYDPTVLGILQKFEHMVGYRAKKTYSLMNGEFVVGGVASTYRMNILKQVNFYDTDSVTEDIGLSLKIVSLGNRSNRMVYGADIVAMTEGVLTFKALVRQRFRWKYGSLQNIIKHRYLIFNLRSRYTPALTVYRLPLALVSEFVLLSAPLAWAYAFYMTFHLYNLGLIIGAYLTITAYTLIAIWFDENLRLMMKLQMTLYAPIAYFVFYIMELVQLIAVVRCLAKAHELLLQKNVGSTWVPPSRLGKVLATNEI